METDPSMLLASGKNRKRFDLARAAAKLSTFPKVQIGAAIIDKFGDIVSVGLNKQKSHPRQMQYDVHRPIDTQDIPHFLHAEMDALIKAKRTDLVDASIYVYRENRANGFAMCRPCKACSAALKDAGIKKIFYTTELGFAYEEFI